MGTVRERRSRGFFAATSPSPLPPQPAMSRQARPMLFQKLTSLHSYSSLILRVDQIIAVVQSIGGMAENTRGIQGDE